MNRTFFIFLTCLMFSNMLWARGNAKHIYLTHQKNPCLKSSAIYYRTITPDSCGPNHFLIKDFFMDGTLQSAFQVYSSLESIDWSLYKCFALRKKIIREGFYRTYYHNGQLKFEAYYKNNSALKAPKYWLINGEPAYFGEFCLNACPPKFRGGKKKIMKYIHSHIGYSTPIAHSPQRKLFVNVAINTKGEVCYVEAQNSIDPNTDAETLRVIQSMPRWKPATLNGKKINAICIIPVCL